MPFRKPAVALAAVTLSFGLTACGGGQSVDEACKVAESKVKDAMGDLGTLNPTDTDAANATIASMTEALEETAADLENTEVKKAVDDLATEFTKLQASFADIQSAGDDTEKLTAVSEDMQAISTDIQEKGERLDELCG